MASEHTYTVGDTVFVEKRGHRHNATPEFTEGHVTKVGRKWVTVAHSGWAEDQFSQETGIVKHDVGCGHAVLWPSEAAYREAQRRAEAWRALGRVMRETYDIPAHLSTEWIEAAVANITTSQPKAPTQGEPAR